jgi:hypothetical protein
MKNKDKIEKLELEIQELKKKIDSIESEFKRKYPQIPWKLDEWKTDKYPNLKSTTVCPLCKMTFEGITGYVCHNYSCPIFMRTTCITSNDTSITCTGDFDIESLDPTERTWSYDGYGVKRLKSHWEE